VANRTTVNGNKKKLTVNDNKIPRIDSRIVVCWMANQGDENETRKILADSIDADVSQSFVWVTVVIWGRKLPNSVTYPVP
jgi:hypothetical protein